MMKIILREDVPNLGVVGDLVAVKDGYARNYLIPQGKASFASVKSIRQLDHQKRLAAHHRVQATAAAEGHKSQIEGLSVCMQAKVAPPPIGEDGEPILETIQKLFGSITTRDLAKVLKAQGIKADHRRVTLEKSIRTVGKFSAKVRLDGGVIATLPFWVIPEGAEDVEAEKLRVEAAQDAVVKAEEEAKAAAEAAKIKAAEPEPTPEEGAENAEAAEGGEEADDAEA